MLSYVFVRQIPFFLENTLKKTTKYFLKFLFFYLKGQSFRLIMAGHVVAYKIGPILNTLSILCSCISPMASRILSFKASIASGLLA